eukprot:SAG11_NODE_544_length_8629_cov_3.550229_7_plen_64_part_00
MLEYPTEVSPLARALRPNLGGTTNDGHSHYDHAEVGGGALVEGGLTERFEAFAAGRELANACV